MRHIKWTILCLAIILLEMPAPVHAQKRLALVIGNGTYQHVRPLRNPTNDARDLADALKTLGFEVILRIDADRREMRAAVDMFWQRLPRFDVGLFYYAGHGVQYQNENYLVPTNARIALEKDIPEESVSAASVLNRMEDANKGLNIVMLDACRKSLGPASSRSLTSGLAQMPSPKGSLVVFATAPNEEAFDGPAGRNGLFTSHLLRHIRTPGLNIEDLIHIVRVGVAEESARDKGTYRKQQIPWLSSSIMGDFYFAGNSGKPLVTPAGVTQPKHPLPHGTINFEDLSSKAEAQARLEEEVKARWAAWQQSMDTAVKKALALEQDSRVNATDKADAWLRIAQVFWEKNPYSEGDTNIRATIKSKSEYWTAQVARESFEKSKTEEVRQAETERLRQESQALAQQKAETEMSAPPPADTAPATSGASPNIFLEREVPKVSGHGRQSSTLDALAGVAVIGVCCIMFGLRRLGFGLCLVAFLIAGIGSSFISIVSATPKGFGSSGYIAALLVTFCFIFGRGTMNRDGEEWYITIVRAIAASPFRLVAIIFRSFRS